MSISGSSSRSTTDQAEAIPKPLIELLPCGSLTDVSSFIYRESNLDEFGRKKYPKGEDSLPRSLYPPESWPSGIDLAKESDVYPAPTPQETSQHTTTTVNSSLLCITTTPRFPKKAPNWYGELFLIKQCLTQHETFKKPIETRNTIQQTEKLDTDEVEGQQLDESFILLKDIIELPVNEDNYSKLCFAENLIIHYEIDPKLIDRTTIINYKNLQEIGGLTINVEPCYNNNFLVYLSTQFSYNLENYCGCRTNLLTILDPNFMTIEEKKSEKMIMVDSVHEKTLQVVKKHNETVYQLFVNELEGENSIKRKGILEINIEKQNFILDGGCLLLMRYLVLIEYVGRMQFNSMHINGILNLIELTVKPEKSYRVSGKKFNLVKIKHICANPNMQPIVTTYYFIKASFNIMLIKWPNLSIKITMNQLKLKVGDATEYNINNDLQLLSNYLDCKSKNKLLLNDYLHSNYNVKNLIKDYIMCLLQLKPHNILEFTIDYFINLCQKKSL